MYSPVLLDYSTFGVAKKLDDGNMLGEGGVV